MSKYEELKYVLSGATDWGYEYAKKEDVEAAFAELEERHAMELDQWVLELGKMKAENERLKKDIDTLKTAWEQSQSALSTIAALKFAAEEKHRASRMALWITRAERYKICEFIAREEGNLSNQMSWSQVLRERTYNQWVDQLLRIANLANKLQNKCRAKAEEYK